MNKGAIKNFAVEARRKLLGQVAQKAAYYGITEDGIEDVKSESDDGIVIGDRVHNKRIKKQREDLVRRVRETGYEQLVEEVAYTWFNRFIALRFMEVNDYLPSGVRVLSSVIPEKSEPDIIGSALTVDLPADKEKIYEYQDNNDTEGLYKYLLITQCNALNEILPFLFEKIEDYTELLLPDNLLFSDSVVRKLVEEVPEEDWREVEIIGWLYQFYISEKKDEVVGMKVGTISKEDIPSATQLFTPKWIVQYMVQNSLGKFWYDMFPDTDLVNDWEYFLKPVEEEEPSEKVKLEDIKLIDPCCGSGHILVYAFDLFYKMYASQGYLSKEIPGLILKNNLYGLDICKRAIQLSCFSLLMKARSYRRRVRNIELNVFELQDTNYLSNEATDLICKNEYEKEEIKNLIDTFKETKNFGSLIIPPDINYDKYLKRLEEIRTNYSLFKIELENYLEPIIKQAQLLREKYHLVITNPPYLNKYNPPLKKFINEYYKDYKSDLYSAFIYKCSDMTKLSGYCGMMSPFTWMFIKKHEKLRKYLINTKTISSLVRPEYHAFYSSAHVPIATFVIQNSTLHKQGIFIDLNDFRGEDLQPIKLKESIRNPSVYYRYTSNTDKFNEIPGSPVAYWASEKLRLAFKEKSISEVAKIGQGLKTGDNSRFVRIWSEVDFSNIFFECKNREISRLSGKTWYVYVNGGEYRKWYGNFKDVVNWQYDGEEIRNFFDDKKRLRSRLQNMKFYFKKGLTWSALTSKYLSVRYVPNHIIYGGAGYGIFESIYSFEYLLAFLNSKIPSHFVNCLSATMNFEVGILEKIPIIKEINQVKCIAENNIEISRVDWDSFENSWDFKIHPFIKYKTNGRIEEAFNRWEEFADKQFNKLKANEEELNSLFIDIYDLQDEMTPEVEDKDITIRKADLERDIKSFISYSVGCMLGRYSLDEPGLTYAGGEFNEDKYKTFSVDDDAIIPILSEDYFEDDIVARFIEFVQVTFGKETLYENLEFIANALGKTSNETAAERIRKYFLSDFYKDHVRIYKKRPIYWLFTSGKQKAFNALIYMHRYDRGMVAKIRTDYLHELQGKLELAERRLRETLPQITNKRDKKQAEKKITEIGKQQEELRKYDELLRHTADMQIEIDLDDGVKVNYEKFKGLVAKI